MSRKQYPTRLANREPLCWLADAWARTQCGADSVAFMAQVSGRRPMPWALSNDGAYAVELWTTIHKIHRRKNGFTHVVDHLLQLEDSMLSLSGCEDTIFEVWEEPNSIPVNVKLLKQWSDRIRSSIIPITVQNLALRYDQIARLDKLPDRGEPNPLLQAEMLRRILSK